MSLFDKKPAQNKIAVCRYCGRTLTSAHSVLEGAGPVCLMENGYSTQAAKPKTLAEKKAAATQKLSSARHLKSVSQLSKDAYNLLSIYTTDEIATKLTTKFANILHRKSNFSQAEILKLIDKLLDEHAAEQISPEN